MNPSFLILILLFVVMWMILIRPQRQRQRQTDQMLASLTVDDEVVTAGGIYGRVTALEAKDVWVEIAPGLTVKVARRAIAAIVSEDETGEPEEPPEEPEPEEAEAAASDRS